MKKNKKKIIVVVISVLLVVASVFLYKENERKEQEQWFQIRTYNEYFDEYATFMTIGGERAKDEETGKRYHKNSSFSKIGLASKVKIAANLKNETKKQLKND